MNRKHDMTENWYKCYLQFHANIFSREYFQKDGLSDKSPLQMLAQTCSQIGADTGTKLTSGAADKVKMTASNNSGKNSGKCGSPTIVVSDSKPVPFKPYENTKEVTAKAVDSKRMSETSSKSASPHNETRWVALWLELVQEKIL